MGVIVGVGDNGAVRVTVGVNVSTVTESSTEDVVAVDKGDSTARVGETRTTGDSGGEMCLIVVYTL